ncbi:MAG: hypothetical protein QM802_25625 [Agriterribacter sp.]
MVIAIVLSVAFFILGLYLMGDLYYYALPKPEGAKYQATEIGGTFGRTLLLSLLLGILPIAIFLLWRYAPIPSGKKRMMSIGIIAGCMLLAIIIRRMMLLFYFKEMLDHQPGTGIQLTANYPLSQVNFEYYLLGGLCVGYILSAIFFRDKKSAAVKS